MTVFRLNDKYTGTAAIAASALWLCASIIFFLPVDLAHKVTLPVAILTLASLWLCPWQISLALLFSATGDYVGSLNNFLGQMGFFALGHIWFISYFINRYRQKVAPRFRVTSKAKGYFTMVLFCIIVLLCIVFIKVVPGTDPGVERIGVCIYAVIISTMLTNAMIQRSSLFALGAVLFVFSDFILAWNKFVEPVPYRHYLVLVSYFLAQWLIFIRATKFRVGPEMRLMRF